MMAYCQLLHGDSSSVYLEPWKDSIFFCTITWDLFERFVRDLPHGHNSHRWARLKPKTSSRPLKRVQGPKKWGLFQKWYSRDQKEHLCGMWAWQVVTCATVPWPRLRLHGFSVLAEAREPADSVSFPWLCFVNFLHDLRFNSIVDIWLCNPCRSMIIYVLRNYIY